MLGKRAAIFIYASFWPVTAMANVTVERTVNPDVILYAGFGFGLVAVSWIIGSLLTVHGRKMFRPPPPVPNMQDTLPFIRIEDDGATVLCERPQYGVHGRNSVGRHDLRFSVIECEGLNYASSSPEQIEEFHRLRITWQARLAEDETAAMILFDRRLMDISMSGGSTNEWLAKVKDRWGEHFKNAYFNKSYIVLIDEGTANLQKSITDTLTLFEVAKPKLLRHFTPGHLDVDVDGDKIQAAHSDLWRFLYELVNVDMPVRAILDADDLPNSLTAVDLEFDDALGDLRITDGIRETHLKFLVLTKIERERFQTDQRLIRRLLVLEHELSIHLCVRPRDGLWSKKKLKERRANREFDEEGVNEAMGAEFDELRVGFSDGEEGFSETEVIIAVRGDTPVEARAAADAVLHAFSQDDNFRAGVATFTVQNEWERRFPSGGRPIRTINFGRSSVADWTPFEGTPRGMGACWWGDSPLRLVRTANGSSYALGVHEHPREEALGNTCLIGKSGSGKTVAASWLASGALTNFPDMQVICFDNMNGLTVPTRAFGGVVVAPGTARFAPLQMDDTPENRVFLVSLLMEMSGGNKRSEAEDIREDQLAIEKGLELIMNMDRADRTLKVFVGSCVHKNSPVGRGLLAWVGNGAYAGWMDGENDSLNFDVSRWITFDMTQLLQQPDICSIYMSYVMHRIQNDLWKGQPRSHIIFIDEAPTMFDMSPLIMETGKYIARNIRKKKGAVWFAFQDAEGMGEAGDVIVRSSSTLAFWRDPSIERKLYKEKFNLSEADLRFISDQDETTKHLRRAALFIHKTERGQESTPLDLSLNSLGELLQLYRSGEDAAAMAEDAIEEFGERLWVQPYIERMRSL